jgi:hypothetical protein
MANLNSGKLEKVSILRRKMFGKIDSSTYFFFLFSLRFLVVNKMLHPKPSSMTGHDLEVHQRDRPNTLVL